MRTSRRFAAAPVLLCAAVALSSCTTMGTGTGSVSPSNEPVTLQVTSTTQSQAFDPLWTGWEYGWGGWGGFGPFPDTAFTTRYSGRVMANLQTADGQHMRCHFHLNHPSEGMGGGGQGQCQLKGGRSVDTVFKPSA